MVSALSHLACHLNWRKQIYQLNIIGLKIPVSRRQTSWLFISKTEELNKGPPRSISSLVVRGGFEPATSGFQAWRPNHSATLSPVKPFTKLSCNLLKLYFVDSVLIFFFNSTKQRVQPNRPKNKTYCANSSKGSLLTSNIFLFDCRNTDLAYDTILWEENNQYVINRPFAVYDHMVQNPPCWRANRPLGHPKQKNIKLTCFVLDVPVGGLLSSMADFVPCDRKLQRAHCQIRQVS